MEAPRTRRLVGDEEDRLLAVAPPHLYAVIVAALSTGCRIGELLSLQWRQVRFNPKGEATEIDLAATKTKTGRGRTLPPVPASVN